MSTLAYTVSDTSTMLRRQLKHMLRYPSLTIMLVGMPVVFLLLFVYVFGGTIGDGLGGPTGGREAYLTYLTPGMLLMAIVAAVQGTAISVAMDMTEGIIDRFRTMSIARVSVLTGHVIGSMIQSFLCMAVTLGVAIAIGFRPEADALGYLGLAGVLALISFGLTWLTVGLGMAAKSVEEASNSPMPLMLLPFLGSAFVPTDSMPTVVQYFAEYQPFTPFIEVVRSLLFANAVDGKDLVLTIAWSLAFALLGYVIAKKKFNKR
ncbi:ABC transporter permease [Glycomyces tritici]|uniref:Transport permease protein n=1 Tax=Glycomyces tritici TaxID=2665176 RepID=A0ABT7YKE8_9ACTN|nr:ABC transporter permease [Glycomyces tritici]MDN3239107.1 ABC transporter permease [Glycomyces tritici]MDN3240269.1 ABC transporter permease [Glycomyces tritici]